MIHLTSFEVACDFLLFSPLYYYSTSPFLFLMVILIKKNQIFNFGTKDGKPADTLSQKHSYILQPVTGKAKYSKLNSSEVADSKQPLQTAVVNLDDVTISLSKVHLMHLFLSFCCVGLLLVLGIIFAFLSLQDGYRDMMKLADNFATFNQRLKYAHFRPLVPVKADSRSWWKYAYKAVSDQMKKARYLNIFRLC
jgi:vacuolar protein sorting-associated protein 13A/C